MCWSSNLPVTFLQQKSLTGFPDAATYETVWHLGFLFEIWEY